MAATAARQGREAVDGGCTIKFMEYLSSLRLGRVMRDCEVRLAGHQPTVLDGALALPARPVRLECSRSRRGAAPLTRVLRSRSEERRSGSFSILMPDGLRLQGTCFVTGLDDRIGNPLRFVLVPSGPLRISDWRKPAGQDSVDGLALS